MWREECFKFYDRLFLTISPVMSYRDGSKALQISPPGLHKLFAK